MSELNVDQAALAARVLLLERRQRIAAAAAALLALGGLAAFTPRGPDVVQARRLDLVGADGTRHATLAGDTSGVVLTLLDKQGRPRAALRLNGEPRLLILDAAGEEVAGLGVPRPRHLAN